MERPFRVPLVASLMSASLPILAAAAAAAAAADAIGVCDCLCGWLA